LFQLMLVEEQHLAFPGTRKCDIGGGVGNQVPVLRRGLEGGVQDLVRLSDSAGGQATSRQVRDPFFDGDGSVFASGVSSRSLSVCLVPQLGCSRDRRQRFTRGAVTPRTECRILQDRQVESS